MRTGKYNFDRKWYEFDTLLLYDGTDIVTDWIENQVVRVDWCTKNFGSRTERPDAWSRWYVSGLVFRFRDEKDYLIFLLRWK